jgi:hypothetical protein
MPKPPEDAGLYLHINVPLGHLLRGLLSGNVWDDASMEDSL